MDRRTFLNSLAAIPFGLVYAGNQPKPIPRCILLLETVLAGFQYYLGEKVWKKLTAEGSLKLIREPHNPHDEKAIEVYFKEEKIGYIPRVDNSAIACLMDQGLALQAKIIGLRQSHDPWERVRFRVELVS